MASKIIGQSSEGKMKMKTKPIEAFALVKEGEVYDHVFTDKEAADSCATLMALCGNAGWKVVRLVEEKAA